MQVPFWLDDAKLGTRIHIFVKDLLGKACSAPEQRLISLDARSQGWSTFSASFDGLVSKI
jgi:hypothetical protein